MSCKHGNHPDACDTCNEIDEAYKSGLADGKQAAIAAQEKKQAMSDAEINAIYIDFTGTPSDRTTMKIARAIERASSPNKELVEALQEILTLSSPAIMRAAARAALCAAGVEVES